MGRRLERAGSHADGRQVKETLGRQADGWTRQKAERALGAKLDAVERGMRKPRKRTFADLADEFVEVALLAKPRKRSTISEYKAMLRNHLRPEFEDEDLVSLSRRPETFERYAAAKIGQGLSPKTVRNHLTLLGLMFKTARRWRWVAENPLDLVERPPHPRPRDRDARCNIGGRSAESVPRVRGSGRRRGSPLVRVGAAHDDDRALDRASSRRATRASLARRRVARTPSTRPASVCPQRDHDSEEQSGAENHPARRRRYHGIRGAVHGEPAPRSRVDCVLASGNGCSARSLEAREVRTEGTRPSRSRRHVSAVARTPSYSAHRDGRGRGPGDVRPGEGRARAGINDGAIPPRCEDELP